MIISNRSILSIESALSIATTSSQSGYGSNDKKDVAL